MEKIFVKDYYDVPSDTFEGDFDTIIDNLKFLVKELENNEGGKYIIFSWHYDYDYQCVRITYERLETNAQFNERRRKLEKILNRKYKSLQERKSLYEKLKEEFEK